MNYIASHWVSCTGDRTYERQNPAGPRACEFYTRTKTVAVCDGA
jgi:hypothetical protein